ncbi:hypothetical protein GGF31_003480 [Allomyces arbusculus]|nr:hypothetical protein GGF31_003480 [Allomyces arbusculus]
MKIVGLTGGIATGKSSVSRHLAACGVPVIDCDQLARQVVEPGTPGLRALVDAFGPEILQQPSGALDRAKLGAIIFADEAKRHILNRITHPAIRRAILAKVIDYWLRGEPLVVVDAPLLIEAGLHKLCNEVVVVYCPDDVQLQRLMKRDGMPQADAEARMRSQKPMDEKLRLATRVLDNTGSLQDLFRQADALLIKMRPPAWRTWAWRIGPPVVLLAILVPIIYAVARIAVAVVDARGWI